MYQQARKHFCVLAATFLLIVLLEVLRCKPNLLTPVFMTYFALVLTFQPYVLAICPSTESN